MVDSGEAGVVVWPTGTTETGAVSVWVTCAGLELSGTPGTVVVETLGTVVCGTAGAVVAGTPGTVVAPAEHLVQIVEVEVKVTVDNVCVVW